MAAAAAAAVASSFSSSIQRIYCTRSKNYWPSSSSSSDPFLKIASATRILQVASLSHSIGIESTSVSPVYGKWKRVSKITAAMTQEEAALMAPAEEAAEEEEGEEEEKEMVEEAEGEKELSLSSDVVEEGSESSSVKTKLYFGNLPYNVDSSQLAGIIQDFGSPELVEVQ